jgi:transposase
MELKPQQKHSYKKVVKLYVSGYSIDEACSKVGIAKQTYYNYRTKYQKEKEDPVFTASKSTPRRSNDFEVELVGSSSKKSSRKSTSTSNLDELMKEADKLLRTK